MEKYKLTITTKDGIVISEPTYIQVPKYTYLSSNNFSVYVELVKEEQ